MTDLDLDLEGVTFTYEDGTQALTDLTFRARRGEFLVVLGANGAGKSTLCFLLSGIVPHIYGGRRVGRLQVAGRDPWDDPIYVTSQRCGVLLQDPEVQLFNPTVRTELAFGPANMGVPREEILRRVEETLALMRLEGTEQRNPRDLSGGQKQRVALGAVLTMRPRVLVLDEPTSQLDPIGRWEVLEAIHRLKATGQVTILMTTHETDDVLDLADQVLVLEAGRLVLQGSPGEVFSQRERLEAAGVKVPDLVVALDDLHRLAGQPRRLTDDEVRALTPETVAQRARQLLREGRLRVRKAPERAAAPVNHPDGPPALEARQVTYEYPTFPPVRALDRVDLEVRQGEFVGIIGQNGSGKSTLVKCFVGLLRPGHGQVLVEGEDIRKVPVGQMSRRVGLVLQNPDYQLFTISAREEVLFGLRNLGVTGPEAEQRVAEALRWVGLEGEAETFPFRLSFGDRRKLAVAATLAMDPRVLILDEPTTAQDHRGRYQIADIALRYAREHGRTVLMITHDMDLVARYAQRLIVMYQGQILLDGPTGEVFGRTEELRRSFLRPPVAAQIARLLAEEGVPPWLTTWEALLDCLEGG